MTYFGQFPCSFLCLIVFSISKLPYSVGKSYYKYRLWLQWFRCTVQYTVQCRVYSIQYTVYIIQYNVQFTVYSVQYTHPTLLYSVLYTVTEFVQCTVYKKCFVHCSVHFTANCSVDCIVYCSVQYTVHCSVHFFVECTSKVRLWLQV